MPTDKWMDKENVAYVYSGILLRHKRNETGSFGVMWMNLESVTQSEVCQKQKMTLCISACHTHTACMWNPGKRHRWACLQGRNRGADVEKRFADAVWEEGKRGTDWVSSTDICARPHVMQTASGGLPCSAGGSAQLCDDLEESGGWMGGGSCLHVAGSLYCTAGTNTRCKQLHSNEGNLFTVLNMNEVSCSVFSLVTTLADGRPCRFTSISIPVLQEQIPHEWNLLTPKEHHAASLEEAQPVLPVNPMWLPTSEAKFFFLHQPTLQSSVQSPVPTNHVFSLINSRSTAKFASLFTQGQSPCWI